MSIREKYLLAVNSCVFWEDHVVRMLKHQPPVCVRAAMVRAIEVTCLFLADIRVVEEELLFVQGRECWVQISFTVIMLFANKYSIPLLDSSIWSLQLKSSTL